MHGLIFSALLFSALPTPTGSADVVIKTIYAPSNPGPVSLAIGLASSASSSLRLATWQLSDSALATALCVAASRSVSVGVVLNLSGGTGTAEAILARQITASGGTVWKASFPNKIANNFLTGDSVYTDQGNYYFSPSAVQAGSYLTAISGTNAATVCASTFATLIASGTLTTALSRPALPPGLEYAPTTSKKVKRVGYSDPLRCPLLREFNRRWCAVVCRGWPVGQAATSAARLASPGYRSSRRVRLSDRSRLEPGFVPPIRSCTPDCNEGIGRTVFSSRWHGRPGRKLRYTVGICP